VSWKMTWYFCWWRRGCLGHPQALTLVLLGYFLGWHGHPQAWALMAVLTAQLGTPRGRYDEHSGKFSLSMKLRFNRPVGERNHLWRLMLAGFGDSSREFIYGAYLGRSFGARSNVQPAHNTTKVLCPNLQWASQSHWFAVNKGLNVSCGNRCLFAQK
jgi:hypothetical protein